MVINLFEGTSWAPVSGIAMFRGSAARPYVYDATRGWVPIDDAREQLALPESESESEYRALRERILEVGFFHA